MVKFGKLSPTNGGAIQVYSDALRDTSITAHLLLSNGKVFFKGCLRITKGNFINAPKARVHEWIRACGRNRADLAGRANDRNTVYAFRTRDATYGLHFAELNGTNTTRIDSGDSPPEQPKKKVKVRAERLATLIAGDFYENRLDLSSRHASRDGASWDSMPEVEAARQIRTQGAPHDAVRMFLTLIAAMDRARNAASLWSAGVALFGLHPEVFDPRRAADLPLSRLKRLLAEAGVSQRHQPDAGAWQRIAKSLVAGDGSPVHKVIHLGVGDADELLKEVKTEDRGGSRFPMLRGPKIGPMWVRMLAEPGEAKIARMDTVRVAVDVHVRRITENLGVASTRGLPLKDARPKIQAAWQRAVAAADICGPSRIAGTCAALDPALWSFGKYGCSHCVTVGQRVPIGRTCDHCQLPT